MRPEGYFAGKLIEDTGLRGFRYKDAMNLQTGRTARHSCTAAGRQDWQPAFWHAKLCRHAHLSVQSGSNDVLAAMGRNYTREEYIDIVDMLRDAHGNYGISTDIIVGFPGESEKDFEKSLMLVEKIPFTKMHIEDRKSVV